MPRFTIIPVDRNQPDANLIATDAGPVLAFIDRVRCGEADVLEDGRYLFSASLESCGFWSVFHRSQ